MGWEGIVSCAVSYVIAVFFHWDCPSQIILIKLINEVAALGFVLILKRVLEQLPLEESQYLCLMKISFVSGKVTWVGKEALGPNNNQRSR
jgi:hypothetical protein